MTMDLTQAIKVALKTKANKELTVKQKKARAVLYLNGYKFEPCGCSEQGYMQVIKNDRAIYISMISDTSKAGVFIDDENNYERCLNENCHEWDCWNERFRKLSDIFQKVDYINLLNKSKFPKVKYKKSVLDKAKSLSRSYHDSKEYADWSKEDLDKAKEKMQKCIDRYKDRVKEFENDKTEYEQFVKFHLRNS